MIVRPDQLKVADEPTLVRDSYSNAILASDLEAKRLYLEEQKRNLNISKIDDLENRIKTVEKSITNIENMLKAVLNIQEQ